MDLHLSIRTRIAFMLAALLVVVALAVWSTVSILNSIERDFGELDEKTAITLNANELLRTSTYRGSALVERTTRAESLPEIDATRAELTEVFEASRSAMMLLPLDGTEIDTLRNSLSVYQSRVDELVTARERLITTRADLFASFEVAIEVASEIEAKFGLLAAQVFRQMRSEPPLPEIVLAKTAQMVRLQGTIDALSTRIGDAMLRTGSGADAAIADAKLDLADAVRIYGSLDFGVVDERLPASLSRLIELFDGELGLFALENKLRGANADFEVKLARTIRARNDVARHLALVSPDAARLTSLRRAEAIAAQRENANRQGMIFVLCGLTIIVIVWILTDYGVVRRIETLTAEMLRIARGDLSAPVSDQGRDEIGLMVRSLSKFRENALELRRSNEDLSNFAYVASHDLRSPLRAIQNLVDWTVEDAGDEIPQEVNANLQMIRSRANRLSQLLSDLLDYARVSSAGAEATVVHLPAMVRDIADLTDPDRHFDISFKGDRCVTTFQTPLQTILLNLISNAIKHHDATSGRIVVANKVVNGWAKIEVADDGPGVPLKYQQKVFELFQKLAPADEVEGSGMGLALVRKLATELGGDVKLISDPDKERGTTFIIDIPLRASVPGEDPGDLGPNTDDVERAA